MNDAWKKLLPKDSYEVWYPQKLSNLAQEVITFLYQPIIGSDAFSIFWTLVGEPTETSLHAELLNTLDMGLPAFYEGRRRLEGVGLLETYQESTDTQHWIYVLRRPVSAAVFFSDALLSTLLLDRVGEKKFQQLIDRFGEPALDMSGYEKRSASFAEVYGLHPERLQAGEGWLEKAKDQFVPETPLVLGEVLDWQLFDSIVAQAKVQIPSAERRKQLSAYRQLYGLDELTMAQIYIAAADLESNEVTEKSLQREIYQRFQENRTQKIVPKEMPAEIKPADRGTYRKNSLLAEGFGEGEVAVILASEQMAPMVFLQSIKDQKKGYIANDERWALEEVKRKSGLPDAVINILTHYVLVVQNRSVLNSKYLNSIANDWAQKELHTPEAAVQAVKQLAENARTNTERRQPAKRSGRKEKLPDWVQDKVPKAEGKELTTTEKEKLAERIKRLTKEGD